MLESQRVLVIGGGIGGLTAAIALRREGAAVEVIERDPEWSVYGVGIIQQANVVRAMKSLDLLDDYLGAGFPYDHVEVYVPSGACVARIPSPTLTEGYPANVGIGRRALHKVLGDRTIAAGANVRLGLTTTAVEDDGAGVDVTFSDGTDGRYDIVVGADGLYSQTRRAIFPDAPAPEFTGQAVWRYNLPRSATVTGLHAYEGPTGVGLVPLADDLMYMYVTTPEPGNPRYPREGLAQTMRGKLGGMPPAITSLAEQITDDDEVVYKPLEWLLLEGPWHKGRIVLLGDAVHATTPHLGQGGGMAIEDSIVLAEELARHPTPEAAFGAYRERRYPRCAYIVKQSLAICMGQLGRGPRVEQGKATQDMFRRHRGPNLRRSALMSRVTEIRYVGYGCPDIAAERRFYGGVWGLKEVAEEDGLVYFAAEGDAEKYVVRLRASEQARIDVIALATDSRGSVDDLFTKVQAAGCKIVFAPKDLETYGGGYGFRFFSADGLPFEISSDVARGEARAMVRWDGVPHKISHIVLHSPDHKAMTEFFINVLGFRLSDWLGDFMSFLRCNEWHHRIAVLPGPPCLNHVAYDMLTVDDMMRGVARLKTLGTDIKWGPGRHTAGNNTFSYFTTPNGFAVEYTSELAAVDDATHVPQVHKPGARVMDQWEIGVGGPQSMPEPAPDKGLFQPVGV